MVIGTDGMDFQHRERVAGQYSVSATNKARLKLVCVLHLALGVAHNIRLLPSILTRLGLRFPSIPLISDLPAPSELEYAWLVSLPFVFMALSACKRSNSGPLKVFQLVILLCCIAPILLTLFLASPELIEYLVEGSSKSAHTVLGQPFSALWSVILLLCLIIHLTEIIVCRTLVQAWAPRHGKKA